MPRDNVSPTLDLALRSFAKTAKDAAVPQRYVTQVTSITDRKTLGSVTAGVGTVRVRNSVGIAVSDWIIVEVDPKAQNQWVFVSFAKKPSGTAPAVPDVISTTVYSPPSEDLTVAAASGQTTIIGTAGDPTTIVGDVGQGSWPLDAKFVVITPGTGYAEYTTIALAIAAASSGDTILCPIGTHTCDAQTLPDGVNLVGIDRDNTVLTSSAQATTLTVGNGCYLANITVTNTKSDNPTYAIYMAGGDVAEFCNVKATTSNGNGAGSYTYGLYALSGTATLRDCWIVGTMTAGGTGYGVAVSTGTIDIYSGYVNGTTADCYAGNAGVVELHAAHIENGTTQTTGAGSVIGYYSVGSGSARRPAMYANGVTRTVGTGKNHATVQAAIDWFVGMNIVGDCYINVDAGSYDEAVTVDEIFVGKSGGLTIRGDTRSLAGLTYVSGGNDWIANHAYIIGDTVFVPEHGGAESVKCRTYRCTTAGTSQNPGPPGWAGADAIGDTLVDGTVTWTCMGGMLCNRNGLTNGGASNGYCQLVGAAGAPTITIKMYTSAGVASNPDMQTNGWDNGDEVLVYDNTGTITKYTISSVATNVITLTANLTNSIGNDGTAVCLLPDRAIDRSSAGRCVTVDLSSGVKMTGFYLETSTGASCDGIYISGGGKLLIENMAIRSEDLYIDVTGAGSSIYSDLTSGGAISCWGGTRVRSTHAAVVELPYTVIVTASAAGVYCTDFAYAYMYRAALIGCSVGLWSLIHANVNALECIARQCATAYQSQANSYIGAGSTGNNNCGNTTNYSPAPALPGYAESAANFGVLYASA